MPATPSLNLLRTFEAAARHLSFRKAADELHITASAVSHQMRDLEDQLGLPLFVRRHRSLTLTPEGERYFTGVSEALGRIDAVTRELLQAGQTPPLRVSAMPFIATDILAPALGSFLEGWPGMQVEVVAEARSMDVAGGEIDIAVRYGMALRDSAIPLVPVACTLVCAPALLAGLRAEPARLGTTPNYLLSGFEPLWDQWLQAQGWELPARREGVSLNTYRGLLTGAARSGVTLGLLPLVVDLLEEGALAVPWPDRLVPMGYVSLEVRDAVRRRPEVRAMIGWFRYLFSGQAQRLHEFFSSRGAE